MTTTTTTTSMMTKITRYYVFYKYCFEYLYSPLVLTSLVDVIKPCFFFFLFQSAHFSCSQVSPNRWRQHKRRSADDKDAKRHNNADRESGTGDTAGTFSSTSQQAGCCVSFAVSLEEYSVDTFGSAAQKAYCAATAESLGVKTTQVCAYH
jgi:hypothetical protein